MKYNYILLLTICLLTACKQDISSEEQDMYDKVMVIHDEVMPKIKAINRSEITLEKLAKTVEAEEDKATIAKTLGDLKVAYDLMFEWMDNFKKKAKLPEGTDYMEYLKKEKVRIQKVSNAMMSSIADADALIKKHQ